jgi:hypothetical protein
MVPIIKNVFDNIPVYDAAPSYTDPSVVQWPDADLNQFQTILPIKSKIKREEILKGHDFENVKNIQQVQNKQF